MIRTAGAGARLGGLLPLAGALLMLTACAAPEEAPTLPAPGRGTSRPAEPTSPPTAAPTSPPPAEPSSPPPADGPPAAGDTLDPAAEGREFTVDMPSSSPRILALESELEGRATLDQEAVELRLELARERLAAGDAAGALAAAQQALLDQRRIWNADIAAGIVSAGSHRQADWLPGPILLIARAALSLSMQGECVARRRPGGCILPPLQDGAHADTAPAQTALSYALELLALRPGDPVALAILNAAAAQAGAPGRVPPGFQAPPGTLLAPAPAGAGERWLHPRPGDGESWGVLGASPGAAVVDGSAGDQDGPSWSLQADLDGDGDAETLSTGPAGVRLAPGGAGPPRADAAAAAGLKGPGPAGPACALDADGDGRLDLLITSREAGTETAAAALLSLPAPAPAGTPRLYRNLGRLRFTDATVRAGLDRVVHRTGALACGDLDGDGAPDIFLVADGPAGVPLPAVLRLNDGSGRFRDATAAAGAGLALPATAAALRDVDGDGDADLLIAIRSGGTGGEAAVVVLENRLRSGGALLPQAPGLEPALPPPPGAEGGGGQVAPGQVDPAAPGEGPVAQAPPQVFPGP